LDRLECFDRIAGFSRFTGLNRGMEAGFFFWKNTKKNLELQNHWYKFEFIKF